MNLLKYIKWYYRIYRIRYKDSKYYPIPKEQIKKIAKFMSNGKR